MAFAKGGGVRIDTISSFTKQYPLLRYFTVFGNLCIFLGPFRGGIHRKTAEDRTLGSVISEIVSKKQYKTAV
jgi:hypothetical protein